MGSWGHGMRESDGAMDAIDVNRDAIDAFIQKPGPVAPFLRKLADKAGEGNIGVLALAEELYERGVDLREAHFLIDRFVKAELKPTALQDFDSAAARRRALLTFQKRIRLKPRQPKPAKPRQPATGPIQEKRPLENGMTVFRRNEWWGFMDASGRVVIPALYDFATDFVGGYALVGTALDAEKIRHRFERIDRQGRSVKAFEYDEVCSDTGDGLRVAMKGRAPNTRYGYIDHTGEWIIPPRYSWALTFSRGRALVEEPLKDDKSIFYFIDKAGKRVSEVFENRPEWDSTGLAVATVRGKDGYLDRDLHWQIRPQFAFAGPFQGSWALVRTGWGARARYGVIDRKGRYVIRPVWEHLETFEDGRARVIQKGRYGFIDPSGKVVVPPQYEEAEDFSQGRAAVKISGRWGFIDRNGRMVVPALYDRVAAFSAGSAEVQQGKKKFLIGLDGHSLSEREMTEMCTRSTIISEHL